MKYFVWGLSLVGICCFTLEAAAQQDIQVACPSFQILTNEMGSDSYQISLQNASLESYRFRNSDRTIQFEGGVTFKLISAKELIACGYQISLDSYSLFSEVDPAITIVFKLCENGKIAVRTEIDPKSKLAKIGAGFSGTRKTFVSMEDFEQMSEEKQLMIRSKPEEYRVE
ncbi:MAG: hypothetical protein K9J17_10015 [Flavobacteriales bacterium]|nr:hypothetical protein [Flavobacteriales bacterium]